MHNFETPRGLVPFISKLGGLDPLSLTPTHYINIDIFVIIPVPSTTDSVCASSMTSSI